MTNSNLVPKRIVNSRGVETTVYVRPVTEGDASARVRAIGTPQLSLRPDIDIDEDPALAETRARWAAQVTDLDAFPHPYTPEAQHLRIAREALKGARDVDPYEFSALKRPLTQSLGALASPRSDLSDGDRARVAALLREVQDTFPASTEEVWERLVGEGVWRDDRLRESESFRAAMATRIGVTLEDVDATIEQGRVDDEARARTANSD